MYLTNKHHIKPKINAYSRNIYKIKIIDTSKTAKLHVSDLCWKLVQKKVFSVHNIVKKMFLHIFLNFCNFPLISTPTINRSIDRVKNVE